jgi:hypothetical protein
MSDARAIRYRRLALAQEDKATADLLLKLSQTNAIEGFSAPLNGVRPGYPAGMSGHQQRETPRRGLGGTHTMTNAETLFQRRPPGSEACRRCWLLPRKPPAVRQAVRSILATAMV